MRLFSWGCEYEIMQETKLLKNSDSYFIFFLENIYWSSYFALTTERNIWEQTYVLWIYIRYKHKTNRSHTFFNYKCAFASPWQKYCRNPMLNCNTSSTYALTVKNFFIFIFIWFIYLFLRANSKCEVWARCPEDTKPPSCIWWWRKLPYPHSSQT